MGRTPQPWLKDGDVVEVGLDQVGTWYVESIIKYMKLFFVTNTAKTAQTPLNLRIPRPRFKDICRKVISKLTRSRSVVKDDLFHIYLTRRIYQVRKEKEFT